MEFLEGSGCLALDRLDDEPLLAAAPITVTDRDESAGRLLGATAEAPTADCFVRGRCTRAPLAAAPMTNLVLGLGGSGS